MPSATTLHWSLLLFLLIIWEVTGESKFAECTGNATTSCINHKVTLALQKITQIPEDMHCDLKDLLCPPEPSQCTAGLRAVFSSYRQHCPSPDSELRGSLGRENFIVKIKVTKWLSVSPCENCIKSKQLLEEKLSRTTDEIGLWNVLEQAADTFVETRSLKVVLPEWIKSKDGALDIQLGKAFQQGRRRGGKKGNNASLLMMGLMGKIALMTMLLVKIKAMKAIMIASVALLMSKMQLFKMLSPTAGKDGSDGGAAHVIVLKDSGGGGSGGGHGGNGGGHTGGTVHVVHETYPSAGWNADNSGNIGGNSWGGGGAWNTGGNLATGWGRRSQDTYKRLLNTTTK